MGDEYDSGDDLFEGVTESELLRPSQPKRPQEFDDDVDFTELINNSDDASAPNKRARTSPELKMRLAAKVLEETFGYGFFRHEQRDAIRRILDGENTLVVFPTGAGKSLCYQIPAIVFEEMDRETGERDEGDSGVTIVVSPLIALMKDQVDALRRRGVAAECIDSTKTWHQVQEITADLRCGKLRLLYCAPERLNNEGFVESIKYVRGGVRLLGVDEAHCISEWGHSFRPDYLKVARFVQEVQAERVVCLTATATPVVADDICKAFTIAKEGVFRTSPYRPNLYLQAMTVNADDKFDLLFTYLRRHTGSTLVYVTMQKQAEEVAWFLRTVKKFKAEAFHAGMKPEVKTRVQDQFMASEIDIVVATIAFGMGIDKPDIRNIVHWDLPGTVEEYCQQVGRAGRDGEDSYCMLYLCERDFYIREMFARGDLPSRQGLRSLFKDIFNDEVRQLPAEGTFKTSHHAQSSEFDIRLSPLGVIYALLELRFNLMRATAAEYSAYSFEAASSYLTHLKCNNTPEAKAILSHARKTSNSKYHHIDPTAVSRQTGIPRTSIIRRLNDLHDAGALRLKTSGVLNKYKVLGTLPRTDGEIDQLTDKVYAELEGRETQAMERTQQVVDLFASPTCFARGLARHFGMDLPDGSVRCSRCTFCVLGRPLWPPPMPPKVVSHAGIQRVLAATAVRDDPRFLARVAFGIRSPRVSRLGLDKKAVFSSLWDHDFKSLLEEFTKACEIKQEPGLGGI
ncbi:ATP-dependent DNA helicase [Sodiomyces alkalinus F11]|uniref:DNA 3'-5' helicase n=1 Tax=Sodiomyces alkalinus (strain CBS 110278 / VKM F-3762 / F11) TaxID=1314773 RepID=A0A3N2PWQ8_SODAK|nr:ATP-dependent DNA helicase [Sodiomyces alkalinus F11]ROT38924.1 ATP-dependent DNA helicase [Sodiomyces alkalinus F11]